jgi:putative transposase
MARIARVVAPGIPHHGTQRGNRRQETFFCAGGYQAYRAPLGEWCGHRKVEVWAYCLMPTMYTRHVNFRKGWRDHPIPGGRCVLMVCHRQEAQVA